MDSLLANYASSDDEQEHQQPPKPISDTTAQRSDFRESSSSLFSSLPPPKPKSSSLPQSKHSLKPTFTPDLLGNEEVVVNDSKSTPPIFSSIPAPKGNSTNSTASFPSPRIDGDSDKKVTNSTSIFSSLPPPNSRKLQLPKSNISSSKPQPKRVVLFTPPVIPSSLKLSEDDDEDEDDEDEDEKRRRRKASESSFQTPSVTSFLSSIPAPKNSATLGAVSSFGSGRKSILETGAAVSASDNSNTTSDSGNTQNIGVSNANYHSYSNYSSGVEQNVDNHRENSDSAVNYNLGTERNAWGSVKYEGYENYEYSVDQNVVGEAQSVSHASNSGDYDYGSYENYGNYGDYGQYGSNPGVLPAEVNTENEFRIPEKRRRKDIPLEILEVKQDELMKNRPREDQVKLTGIAFGPSYQPASSKGKPTKLHKRKHQINSLYFDMKQKETELAERRARGFLTKAETQAKYGW